MEERKEIKDTISNLDSKITDKVVYLTKNSKQIGGTFAYFAIIIISMILGAASSILDPKFSGNVLTNPNFWVTTALMAGFGLVIIYTVGTKHKELARSRSRKLIENGIIIETIIKNNVESNIDEFVAYRNIERKIRAWKEHINNKIRKIDKKASDNDIIIYSLKDDVDEEGNIILNPAKVKK